MSTPQRILIVRLSAIGDVVMASGLIPALRARHPDAHLAWLIEPAAAPLLAANPRLDEVIVWPRGEWQRLRTERRWRELAGAVRRFVGALRARRFDLVLDTQGLLKSGLLARASGAATRIGLGSKEGSRYLMTRVVARDPGGPRLIGREYRALAAALGCPPEAFRMDLATRPEDAVAARERLAEAGVDGPYAVLAPFTTRPQKHWFEERWAALAPRLAARLGLPVVLLGGPGDREAAARIATAAPGLRDLAGRTSLAQTVAAIRDARLLIGVDTGLTHMGIACEVPTLALFGSTRPYLDPGTPRARVLYHALPCSPCRRRPTCGGRFDCMRAHEVDGVLAAAVTLPGVLA
ncbi:heptosyltransferase-1 [Plasticicumulans lactativorans]|uniref:Heptosyltransferase-1 n=1 Tax=Plasticicumulans lactativorans TaxID=1133106 RepID=A0A4R2L4Q1_9GAMM|nr:glycosyltransferase family 9 protein [Plasticicumulans lactativorans]TCO81613.1 heptosyltransferase-1 [Plasticicumulans lactativorans]